MDDKLAVDKQLVKVPIDKKINEIIATDTIAKINGETNSEKYVPDSVNRKTPSQNIEKIDSVKLQQEKIAEVIIKPAANWRIAIIASFGSSGVNNGVGLFGGGAKSLETNAFADASNFSSANPANPNPGNTRKPPSSQNKSTSFSLGLLLKKQVSKRIHFSTGLQYNFYSTKMLVGQNIKSDTMARQNKNVANFYANSGSNFSNYQNKFHFLSLP